MPALPDALPATHVFDATTAGFEADVLQKSMQTPVLVDFWAPWCEPCKQLGPVLEKLAAEYHGSFELAKVEVDQEPQLAEAFQVRSIPTVFLVKGGQIADGFPGVLPEGQIREFLKQHGVEPAEAPVAADEAAPAPVDPQAEVARLRAAVAEAPDNAELRLDLALALLKTEQAEEAVGLLEGLPANLATDDRTVNARARLAFIALANAAPALEELQQSVARDPDDLRARHLLGARHIVAGNPEAAMEQFIEMLARDRDFDGGLPRTALIDAFRITDDTALVGRYRRRMSSLLF
ncbi:thioredoxin [Lysobacter sp. A03]|uniref:thioredoxin n=1 Tax=Lysobacter sp. A03 TaxID=1199154 RepID=UPI0005B700EB|nr:thioredoxin [Lysobacter sp. A03]KIQ96892.1 Thioredoxin domain-containing protein EC-YbbN [Lysobacter sp. A03]